MAIEVSRLGLDCRNCDDILKRENGCEGLALRAWWIEGKLYRRCPLKLVDNVSWELFTAYGLFKSGHLPQGKGWLQESEKYNSAMLFIRSQLESKSNGGSKIKNTP